MPDLDIDQLNIRISSDSKTAEQSLTNLTAALTNLKDSLSKVGSSARAVSKLADSFSRLKDSAKDIDLSGLASQLSTISRINIKDTGIASFINSMKNFDKVSKNLDFSAIQDLKTQLSGLSGVSSNVSELLKSTASFARASGKMQEAAQNFPGLASAIRDFFDSMAGVDVSDNTVRMAEALSQISQNGKKAGAAMQSVQTNTGSSVAVTSRAERVWKLFGDTLKETGSMLKDIGQSIASLAKNIGSGLVSGVKTLVSQFKQLTSASSGLKNLAFNLKMLLGTFVGFYGIRSAFNWVKDAVTSGADVAETNHIIEATFGSLAKEVDDWSQTTMDKYGIAENAAKRYAGTLGAVFQSSGVGMKESAEMSQRLVEIAGDLSSFYNIDTETVYTKLKSGMAGMVRPLRDVGIDLSVASLSAFALEQGITKSWQSMSQAEKIALRYQYILQATQRQQGDFANTSRSMANALRTLRAYAQSITETIGDGLASALRHVVRWMNRVAAVVLKVAKAFATFMHTLFGKNVSGGGISLGDDSAYEDVADNLDDAATSAGDTSDGLGDAADNAQKLAKSLSVLPFDELNQLNKDTEKSSSGSGGSGGGLGGLGDLGGSDLGLIDEAANALKESKLPEAVDEWAQRIKDAFMRHDWKGLGQEIAWGINKGLDWLYNILDPKNVEKKVLPWVRNFATVMNSLVDSIHWDVLGRTLGRGLNDLFLIANTWLTSFDWVNLGIKFAEGANGLVSEIRWDWLGQLFANGINSIWQRAYGFVSTFDWHSLGVGLSIAFRNMIDTIDFKSISGTITDGLNGIITAYNGFIASFPATSLGAKLGKAMKEIINGVHADELGDAISRTWNRVWALLSSWVRELGDKDGNGTGLGTSIATALRHVINGVKIEDMVTAISTLTKKIFEDIAIAFGDEKTWKTAGEKFGETIGRLLSDGSTWARAADAINAVANALVTFFTNAIRKLWEYKDKIAGRFRKFLISLDWSTIFKAVGIFAVGALVKVVPMLAWKGLKTALETQFIGIFKQVGTAGAVKTAANAIFEPIINVIGSAGAGAATGTLIGAIVMATKEMQSFFDAARGGNGYITEEGGIFDSIESEMIQSGIATKDTTDKIFDLKEQLEDKDIDRSTFVARVAEELGNAGVNGEQLESIVRKLGGTVNITDAQMSLMNDVIDHMAEKTNNAEAVFEKYGITSKQAVDGVIKSIGEMPEAMAYNDEVISKSSVNIQQQFRDMLTSGTDFGQALLNILPYYTKLEGGTEALRQKIDDYLGEGAFDALIASAQGASDSTQTGIETVGTFISTLGTVVSNAGTKVDNWATKIKTAGTNADAAKSSSDAWQDSMSEAPSLWDTIKVTLANVASGLVATFAKKADFDAEGKNSVDGWKEGFNENLPEAVGAVAAGATGLVTAFKSALGIASPSTVFKTQANFIPQGIAEGITLGTQKVLNSITTLTSQMSKTFSTAVSNMTSQLNTGGSAIANGLAQGFQSGMSTFNPGSMLETSFSYAISSLQNVESQMYYAGMSIIQGLQNGLNSMHLSLPDITVSWDRYTYGDGGWFDVPSFSIHWYARDGLLTHRTIAGFGEAGDEAALPLENSRVMNRIANAIVDNSNGAFGIDEATLASAVAQGYVQAMMANQGNQQQPIFNIVVKTEDNEVLARAVQRGQQSMDYRNNPTPRYSY